MSTGRGPRIRWFDLHNLLGIVTLAWACVMGATGVLNTLDSMLFGHWQKHELAALLAPYHGLEPVRYPTSVARATAVARRAMPDREPSFVAYPGSFFSSRYHYTVFARGDTLLTSRLLAPVLVDARALKVSAVGTLPWYLIALEASRPLHFGDDGVWPFKLLWALLDIASIVVLASGLYLWIARRWAQQRRRS
ncbi:PepSY-associated TM helix domain-containing protein [Caballeronia sp. LZ035]|uniref:PepSY-associated TM helix domain-containing protein n=1 Tax=Caballeronia sp. LZ035 TaxID=3038568 RepID=UPI0028679BFA|nr:PepSY-associated TM helix domain-containing protein [Caballeronia sp. LZ035]MDR5760582.1 PepSY-associated TM helix domain-containing protein [Caballeronia sp. LZ035]